MSQPLTVKPGTKIKLQEFAADFTDDHSKEQAEEESAKNVAALDELAYRLYAENKRSLLVVLQGMDTAGKDGTIRHVMQGFNPACCSVVSFKQPSLEELDHDFLWRIHHAAPRHGEVAIFNRSHYEDVLVVRVHNLVPEPVWKSRYDIINTFEQLLVHGNTVILKFFLHISNEEQRKRLQKRLDDPTRRWKFSQSDLAERKLWSNYQAAYEEALTRCNTEHAPWYIVPADKKWYRNLVVSRVMRETLERMHPQFPPAQAGLEGVQVE